MIAPSLAKERASHVVATLCILVAAVAGSAAPNPARGADSPSDLHFGEAVSVSANSALIGSPYGADGKSAGLAFVFGRASAGWTQITRLSAMGAKQGDKFGSAMAIAEGTALIGAWGIDGVAAVTGSAFVFERGPNGWNQVAVLTNPDARERQLLGYSVALGARTAVVGAPGVNTKLWSDRTKTIPAWSGAVYIWSKDESGWRYQGRITPDELDSPENPAGQSGPYHLFENFGRRVALHDDIVVVSAQNGTIAPGKVYVFRRRNDTWKQEAVLQQQQESFGVAVAVTARTIAVASSGLVFLYADVSGSWNLQSTVEPSAAGEPSGFQYGGPVAIDENLMVVGAARYRKRKGAVHVFERVGSSWNQVATITGEDTRSDSGNRSGDLFGGSVSISGGTVLVGASFHDSEGPNFGAAYVFRKEGTQWIQTSKLVPPTERHRGTKAQ
jgi:hypothetical protein